MEFLKINVSLVIVTLNEEKNLKNCITSVPWVNDIVVLDSGSKDKTEVIALSLGARFFQEPWRGFGPQKRRAVELAKNDWVLCLDGDEQLTPELSKEVYDFYIQKIESQKNIHDGGGFPRRSYHLGRWIDHGGWYPDVQFRFFNKKKCNWSDSVIHEKVEIQQPVLFKNNMIHYPFLDLKTQVAKNNNYSSVFASQLSEKGVQVQIFHHLLIKPFVKFLECYIFKGGFRDGVPGYIIAIGAAYSQFLKYAKLWELQNSLVAKNAKITDK